ncbi:MAG: sulfite oxidase-like oxidoreductase [Dehalococcoidia bacterium]
MFQNNQKIDPQLNNENSANRTPPGQKLTDKFPVLTYGDIPHIPLSEWTFTIDGLVNNKISYNWDEMMSREQTTLTKDFHCVTQWSRLDNLWEGIRLKDLVKEHNIKSNAKYVLIYSYGGYTTNLLSEVLLEDDVLLAHKHDGNPLTPEHGGPMRLIVPRLYAWKSAKWIKGINFIETEELGFWENLGYHSYGDPWQEQRFKF